MSEIRTIQPKIVKKFSKIFVYMAPEVVLFLDIVENAGPFPSGNFRKCNRKFWLNKKRSLFPKVGRNKTAIPCPCPKPPCEAYISPGHFWVAKKKEFQTTDDRNTSYVHYHQ